MKIFVTGGTGFIGQYVVKKLDDGKNKLLLLVRNLQNQRPSATIQFLKDDLGNISTWADNLEKFKPDATIHLAWEGIPDYSAENSTRNLIYGLELIHILVKINCKKILITGSAWEYGKISGKLSENLSVEPFNCFTAAKNSLSWMGKAIAKENHMLFLWTRLFYVYGPGQKSTSLISYLINCLNEGKKPKIRNLNAKNDFIYVEDVANAISKLILEYNHSNIFNIGSEELINVQTIIEKIYGIYGKRKDYQTSKQIQTDTLPAGYADISKIKKAIDWYPQIGIEEGLIKTLDVIKSSS